MSEAINLLWSAFSEFPHGQFIRSHAHESFFHLFYCVSGEADFRVEGETVRMSAGRALLAGAGRRHEMLPVEGDGVACLELKFSVPDARLREDLMQCGPGLAAPDGLRMLLDAACAEAPDLPYGAESLQSLACLAAIEFERQGAAGRARRRRLSPAAAGAVGYIDAHYAEVMLLEHVARALNLHPNYLCTLFKRETGVSTNEYLNMVRTYRAAQRICYGDMEIQQVAAQCGFASASHFSRTFKKYAGVTPSECRQLFYREVMGVEAERDGMVRPLMTISSERLLGVERTLRRIHEAEEVQ